MFSAHQQLCFVVIFAFLHVTGLWDGRVDGFGLFFTRLQQG